MVTVLVMALHERLEPAALDSKCRSDQPKVARLFFHLFSNDVVALPNQSASQAFDIVITLCQSMKLMKKSRSGKMP